MSVLPADLQHIVADLDAKASSDLYPEHARDVFVAIKQHIESSTPIPKDLQDQYVQAIANEQRQDRYGK